VSGGGLGQKTSTPSETGPGGQGLFSTRGFTAIGQAIAWSLRTGKVPVCARMGADRAEAVS